jgi:hypothetical protein
MSLLGFDALGRWALGQLPGNNSAALSAGTGSFGLTGQATTFTIADAKNAGSFGLSGIASQFGIGCLAAAGPFVRTGQSAAFGLSEVTALGGYVLTGIAAHELIGEAVNPPGTVVLLGMPITLSFGFATASSSFSLAGSSAILNRDFVNWLARPLDVAEWSAESALSPEWTIANSQAPPWRNASAPLPGWSLIASPSSGWTVDPIQQIPPPVSE